MFHLNPAIFFVAFVAALSASGPAQDTGLPAREIAPNWERLLAERLPAYGHRNWIVVADSAYPSQSRAGIETVVTNDEHLHVVQAVLEQLQKQRHVRPNIYLDAELPFVEERNARGIGTYRDQLTKLLAEHTTRSLNHEQIIDKLDTAGEKFNVLVLKTNFTLPYTSVFMELDCAYWSAEQEQRLRDAINDAR